MRVSTPELTWVRILERAQSATSALISMPRFMGPGWQMMASGRILLTRAMFRPQRRLYSRRDGMDAPSMRSSWTRSM